jgi:predicted restriction endonuclease
MQDKLYFPKLYSNKDKIQAFNMLEEKTVGLLIAYYILSDLEIDQITSRLSIRISSQDFFDILEYFGINRFHKSLMNSFDIEEFIEYFTNYESSDEEFNFLRNFLISNQESLKNLYNSYKFEKFEDFVKLELFESFDDKKIRERYYNSFVKIRNSNVQSEFRDKLFDEFQHKCAICNIKNESLLIASHIIPYHICWEDPILPEDSENGLLLCVLHDAIFESGRFITFNEKGKIIINPLIEPEIDNLGISQNTQLPVKYLTSKRVEYLEVHAKLFQTKKGKL